MSESHFICLNSLPSDKILDLSKLKAIANDNINVANTTGFVFDREENIVLKATNPGF